MMTAPPGAGRARQRQDAAHDGPWPPAVRRARRPGGAAAVARREALAAALAHGLACDQLRRALATWRARQKRAPAPGTAQPQRLARDLYQRRARAVAAWDRVTAASGADG